MFGLPGLNWVDATCYGVSLLVYLAAFLTCALFVLRGFGYLGFGDTLVDLLIVI